MRWITRSFRPRWCLRRRRCLPRPVIDGGPAVTAAGRYGGYSYDVVQTYRVVPRVH